MAGQQPDDDSATPVGRRRDAVPVDRRVVVDRHDVRDGLRAVSSQPLVWLGVLVLCLGLVVSLWPDRPETLVGRVVGIGLVGAAVAHLPRLRDDWRER